MKRAYEWLIFDIFGRSRIKSHRERRGRGRALGWLLALAAWAVLVLLWWRC